MNASAMKSIIIDAAARLASYNASVCYYFAGRYFAYYYSVRTDCLNDPAVP